MKSLLFFIFLNCFSFFLFSQKSIEDYKNDSILFSFLESDQFDKAETKAFEIIENNDKDSINIFSINAHTVLGIINKRRGYYISAIENYLLALNKSVVLNDSGRVSSILNNIGTIHNLQENFPTAIEYFKKSLAIELKRNDLIQRSIRYYNIADSYYLLDSFELAINYYSNSLLLESKAKNFEGIVYAKLGLASIYDKLNDNYQVKQIIDDLDSSYFNLNSELKVMYLAIKGKYEQNQNNHLNALSNFEKAILIADSFNYQAKYKDIIKLKIDSHISLKNYKKALKLYEDYYLINKQLLNTEIIQKTGDLNYLNELNLKKQEIFFLESQNEELNYRKEYLSKIAKYEERIIIIAIILILVIISFSVYLFKIFNKNDI